MRDYRTPCGLRKLKLFLSMLMLIAFSVGNVWAVDPVTVKSTFSKATTPSNNQVTDLESAVTWDISTDGAVGSPSYAVGSADSKEGLKFGASKSVYYGKIDLSTDYFKNYNVKSVKLYVKNNGSKIGTLTAKQGSVTIGTQSNTSATNAWNEMTASGTTGEGGILTVSYEVAQASYINYIEVTYEVPVSTDCENKITITKAANPANGTFEIDNSGEVCIDEGNVTVNVTAIPDAHYHLATVTSTVGTIGSIAGNTCEITDIDADTEIGVTFAQDTKYVVTWNVNGNEDTKTNVYAGEKPVFPATPAACDAMSTTFIGWATAPWTGKLADLSEKTVYTSASAMPDVDAAVTYYAVFAKSSGSASELFSWAGGGKEALLAIEGIVSSSLDADYAASHSPYQVKWNGDGKYLIIPVSAQPGKLSVGFKMIGGATTSTVDVQESTATDGEFTNVETLTISGATNDIVSLETTNAFKSTTRAIKLLYHKGSNVGLGPISIEGAVSYEDYMTTCCTQYNVNIAAGIENGSVSADPTAACEGAMVTLTFMPALNYHLSAWTLNGEAQDIAENTFTMPGADVTVSATFAQDACEPLGTPSVAVSGKAYPYDAVKLAWSAIDNADAYKVYIYDAEDNELEHNDAVTGVEYTIDQALSASTTYKYSVQAVSNTPATYCPSEAATGSFVTEALPTAHLTLIALGDEHEDTGDYSILTPFNLPSTAAACSKTFRGWDANSECATAPTYAAGAEFTFQNTDAVTLYAVYADETPGEATLTKLGSGATFANGDKLVIAAKGTNFGIYFENAGSAYVKNWEFAGADPVLSELTDTKKILTLVKSGDNWKFGDATNGHFYSSSSNNLEISTTNSSEFNSFSWNTTESAFTITKTDGRYLNCRTDLTSGNKNLWRFNGTNTNSGSPFLYVYKYAVAASTFSNYSTTCVAAPTAEPASASIAVAAAGGEGTLGVSYENVNLTGVEVALFNNEACTEAFDGGWLTASIAGDDKHIAYNAQANTSYKDARTAYIKLTAPETSGAANPAVVVIPVEQAKKPAVFASLEDLVAAELASGTEVTVSFSNVMITEVYTTNAGYRYGLYLNVKDKDGENDIELFYNKQGDSEQVPDTWVKNGYVSATNLVTTWTEYKGQWELAMQGATWSWENGDITYGAPKAVSSVVVSGEPAKKAYVDGEKFNPAGLTVTVNYTVGDPEVIAVTDADWEFTPERLAKGETGISVKATYNTIQSAAFNVTGLTVGDIQLKTVEEFIAAGNADMRCYLEGIVSDIETGSKLKYGNFNLTDASGTIYVYGCLNQNGVAQKFDELGVANGDKIKVIAEDYDYYNYKHEAKNVQFVSKTSPVDITITSGSTVEKGKTLTLTATTDPAAAIDHIFYSVKVDGNEGNVSLSDNVLTGVEVGEATIIASIPDGEGYIANSVEFSVEVTQAIVHASITYVENGANEDIDDVADATALPDPLPTVTKDNFLFGGWYTDAEFNTPAVAGAALSDDIILYAKWNAIPYWATVYTSNVEFTGQNSYESGGSKVVIAEVEYDAQKVGASSNQGQVVVTVPAKTHTLHFHVFTWKNKSNVISISGVTNPSATTFDVIGDNGGGASSPYTIEGNPIDHYYSVTFDAVTDVTDITFDFSSGGDKRFIMYGINQEGGVLPVLDHIVITGNASATEYEAGDVFSLVGLGVDAYYTLDNDPIEEPTHLDVDENWSGWSVSPAILTAETESVTVTATYEDKQANKNVNVTVTAPETPEIIASPAAINFGTVNQGAIVDAQGISVTLKAVAAATVTLDGAGFTIDKAALSELNSTVTVTPVTTATGTFAATVTISDDADAADDVVINLSMTVEAVEDLSGTWIKATSVAAGDRIIIGATVSAGTKTMGQQNSKNRAAVASTLEDQVLTPAEGTKTFLVVDAGDGKFALQALNGKYLTSATSGTGNELLEAASYENDNAKWTIEIDGEGVASVVAAAGSRTYMKYNNGSTLFSCYQYETSQSPINIYKKGTPDYGSYQRNVTSGNYGTICLPQAGTITGATLFEIGSFENEMIYVDEVLSGELEAGKPYIFQATADQLNVTYTSGTQVAAGEANGLHGFYNLSNMATDEAAQKNLDENAGNYILYQNAYWLVSGRAAYINNFRAYIKIGEIENTPAPEPTPGQAPRRRVAMTVHGEQVATGMENVQGDNVQCTKVLINGQLFILRGEKMFDAKGQLVK